MKKLTSLDASRLALCASLGLDLDPVTGRAGKACAMQQQQAFGGANVLTTNADTGVSVDLRTADGATLQVEIVPDTAPGGGGVANSYVFRPGGTAAVGVFVTSAALAAAMLLVDSAAYKVVTVDTVDGAAHIASGVTLPDNILFKGGGGSPLPTLTFDEGSHLSGETYQFLDIAVVNAATTAVWSPAVATAAILNLTGSTLGPSGAGTLFIDLSGELSISAYESFMGDGTNALIAVESTGAVFWLGFDGSTITPNTLKQGTAPGGVVDYVVDGASQRGTSVVQVPVPAVTVLDPLTSFVLQPGGTDGGIVFTTWTSLYAVAHLSPDPAHVTVDSSLAAATVPTGTYSINGWTLGGAQQNETNNTLQFQDNVVLAFNWLFLKGHLGFENVSTATTPITVGALGAGNQVTIWSDSAQAYASSAAGTKPLVEVVGPTGSFLWQGSNGATLGGGAGTNPTVTVDAGATAIIRPGSGATVNPSAVTGAGTGTWIVAPGATVNQTGQTITTWTWLEASNTIVAANNAGTGTGTVTVTTSNISKKKSGQMEVSGSCLLSTSASASTLTLQLKRDAANIGTAKTLVVPASGIPTGIDCTINAIDTAPDNAAHTYTLSVSVSAGTLTVAANSAQIQVVEDS